MPLSTLDGFAVSDQIDSSLVLLSQQLFTSLPADGDHGNRGADPLPCYQSCTNGSCQHQPPLLSIITETSSSKVLTSYDCIYKRLLMFYLVYLQRKWKSVGDQRVVSDQQGDAGEERQAGSLQGCVAAVCEQQ